MSQGVRAPRGYVMLNNSVHKICAMLTERINKLSQLQQGNKKDYSSRRGLLKMIGRRKRLLSYIAKKDVNHYRELIGRLGIRR